MSSLDIAATGMLAQQLNVEVISNNIANMNTTGFKRWRAEFQDLLYQDPLVVGSTTSASGTVESSGVQIGTGVKSGAVYRIINQGNLVSTENPFDLAIQGIGHFRVTLAGGQEAYTRAGSFQLSATGQIVTADGFPVSPGLVIPSNAVNVSINESGQVEVKLQGQIAPVQIGQIGIYTFANEAGLEAVGGNYLLETPASGTAVSGTPGTDGMGTFLQGFLETSNVNAVTEITNLITAQRAYEMNSKVIQTSDEMLATTTQLT